MESTDRELLDQFCDSGDAGAFNQLVRRHGPMVLGVCRRVLRDSHDADDAFQATFLVLSRKASSIRDRTTMSHWLYQVAVHASRRLKAQREQRRRHEQQGQAWIAEAVAEGRTGEIIAPVIDEEVEKLPAKVRGPIVMCCFEGKTYGEAAIAMQCSEATIRGRLARARDMLRHRLERRGITVPAAALMAGLVASRARAQVPQGLAMAASSAAGSAGTGTVALVGITARAAALGRDVLKGMFWAKVKLAAVPAIVAALLLTSTAPLYSSIPLPRRRWQFSRPRRYRNRLVGHPSFNHPSLRPLQRRPRWPHLELVPDRPPRRRHQRSLRRLRRLHLPRQSKLPFLPCRPRRTHRRSRSRSRPLLPHCPSRRRGHCRPRL